MYILCYKSVNKKNYIACVEAKQARKPFKKIDHSKATSLLELVHCDLFGPMSEVSLQGNRYGLILVDDFSRMIFVYFLASKADVKEKFKSFQSFVERQTGAKIKIVRTDNGTEFVNQDLSSHFSSCGIVHQTTVPHSPQQNGIAERTIRFVIEKARSMLAGSFLSKSYWQDAVQTAVYLKNRSPHRALGGSLTPFERWYNVKPNLAHLKVFGCRALVHVPSCERKKLDLKAKEFIFVGYSEHVNSYLFRDAQVPKRLVKARDVTFFEDRLYR